MNKKKTQEIEKNKLHVQFKKLCINASLTKQWEEKQKIRECKYKLLELQNPKALQTTLEIVKREEKCKMLKRKTMQTK